RIGESCRLVGGCGVRNGDGVTIPRKLRASNSNQQEDVGKNDEDMRVEEMEIKEDGEVVSL
ncbi:hypothetical protein KI387_029178, partial [Taxus chinensis]